MPFTFSHPALALPLYFLHRKYFSLTGLIVGSIAPDFEYFIRLRKGPSLYSHSWPALFWFNLPLGLGLAFLFHGVVKKPFIQNLPQVLFTKFNPYVHFNWLQFFKRHWLVVIISVLIGAASHLLWDWFTHASIYFTFGHNKLSFKFYNWYFQVYTYTLLHGFQSLIGLFALFFWMRQLPGNKVEITPAYKRTWYWPLIALVSIAVVLFRLTAAPVGPLDEWVTIIMAAVLLSISTVSFLFLYFTKSFY